MIRTTPFRRTILHFAQRPLMDGRTFILLLDGAFETPFAYLNR